MIFNFQRNTCHGPSLPFPAGVSKFDYRLENPEYLLFPRIRTKTNAIHVSTGDGRTDRGHDILQSSHIYIGLLSESEVIRSTL